MTDTSKTPKIIKVDITRRHIA